MAEYRHHSLFGQPRLKNLYRFPNVCTHCRKSFKKPESDIPHKCPECGGAMVALSRKFHAPSRRDLEQWDKVAILIENGFRFHPVYRFTSAGVRLKVEYPKTRKDAEEFVRIYTP